MRDAFIARGGHWGYQLLTIVMHVGCAQYERAIDILRKAFQMRFFTDNDGTIMHDNLGGLVRESEVERLWTTTLIATCDLQNPFCGVQSRNIRSQKAEYLCRNGFVYCRFKLVAQCGFPAVSDCNVQTDA